MSAVFKKFSDFGFALASKNCLRFLRLCLPCIENKRKKKKLSNHLINKKKSVKIAASQVQCPMLLKKKKNVSLSELKLKLLPETTEKSF